MLHALLVGRTTNIHEMLGECKINVRCRCILFSMDQPLHDQRKKLSWADKVEIHSLYTNRTKTGHTMISLAEKYGVVRQTIALAVDEIAKTKEKKTK